MRVLGVREIASGLGILTQPKPAPWLWARVGGDAMDLALLRRALSSPRADHNRVAAATAAVAGIAAVDALCSTRLTAEADAPDQTQAMPQGGDVHAKAAVTVNAPLAEVYAFWEDFRNLPRFMGDFASVEVSGGRRSRWSLTAPAGITLDWDVEIADATPNERITWQTAEGTALNARARCVSGPPRAGRGTEVVFDATSTRRAASWARRSPASLPRRWARRSAATCAASSNWSSWVRSSTPTTASSRDPIPPNRRARPAGATSTAVPVCVPAHESASHCARHRAQPMPGHRETEAH